jgi:DNA-directed RNA polymerase subunit H (RpoH/RPB5)
MSKESTVSPNAAQISRATSTLASAGTAKIATIRISKNEDEIQQTCITTLIEYLLARGLLSGVVSDWYETIWKTRTDDNVFRIWIPKRITGKEETGGEIINNGSWWVIKFIPHKITSLNSNASLVNFMNQNEKCHKIVVAKDLNAKVYEQLANYGNTEVLLETDLMMNVLNHILQPNFEILTPEEQRKVRAEYLTKPGQMKMMYEYDAVAIALGLKHGDVVRIISPSEGAGKEVNYRTVIRSGARV